MKYYTGRSALVGAFLRVEGGKSGQHSSQIVTFGRRQGLYLGRGAKCGSGRQWAQKIGNSSGLPMDFLWTPYGHPMDFLWNNTGATPEQHVSTRLGNGWG